MSGWSLLLSPKIIYLLYPLSFLVMFVAIVSQRGRTAHLELLDSFYVLAFFGLFHGLAEFVLVWQVFYAAQPLQTMALLVRFGLNILSFQFLLYFGFMMLTKPETRLRWFIYFTPLMLGLHYIVASKLPYDLGAAYEYSNWLIAFPGTLVASIAFFVLSRKLEHLHLKSLMWDARALTVAFLVYGLPRIWSIFVPYGDINPSVPILFSRIIFALMVTFFVVRMLSIFKLKSPKRSV